MTIAGLTALEAIRQPITLIVSLILVAFISLLPVLVTHTLGESDKLIRDSGLALQFTGGLLLGSFMACAALTHEIRRGTVASVLAKPVGRELFFLAKFAGVALILLAFSLVCGMATLLSTRMVAESFIYDWWAGGPLLLAVPLACLLAGLKNYFLKKPFASNALVTLAVLVAAAFIAAGFTDPQGHRVAFGLHYAWKIVPAVALIAMAILILTGVAVSLATRLDTVPTLALCSIVFLIGLMSDYLLGRHAAVSPVAAVLYWIIPNFQHFWTTDALNGPGVIPWRYVAQAGVYAALYLAGVLGLGMLAFRHMEVRA